MADLTCVDENHLVPSLILPIIKLKLGHTNLGPAALHIATKASPMPDKNVMIVETRLRVRYAETDMMGIVHHSNYIVFFEEARSEYARQRGTPYSELEKMGFSLAVTEVQVTYRKPAIYEQVLIVRTWLTELRSRGMTFEYEICDDASGERLVTGQTRHICIDRTGRAVPLPERWRNWQV